MSVSIPVNSPSPFTNSITIPDSASFIGSSDDALALQMVVLISTSDRFREAIRSELVGAQRLMTAIESLSNRLNQFGQFVKGSSKPVTYASLISSGKDAATLRTLFAADGPNLGDTLAASEAALAALKGDGVSLNAPKQTPLMVEKFTAVDGKVDLTVAPTSSSVSWQSDQDLTLITPGTTAGTYPGSMVKSVETRDSKNKLVSVTRYTVFTDYANLRPKQEDLQLAYTRLQQNLLPLLAEFESALNQVKTKKDSLDNRVREEMSKVTGDQKIIDSLRQSQSDDLLEALRLIRVFRADLGNRVNRPEKNASDDSVERETLPPAQSISQANTEATSSRKEFGR
jgi:hypothetical protein